MRTLSQEATSLLEVWCANLPIEEAAYHILPEEQLERAIEQDSDAVRKLIRETSTGIAEYRLDHLVQQPIRSRSLVRQIHELYEGRCQVCGFDPLLNLWRRGFPRSPFSLSLARRCRHFAKHDFTLP